MPEITVTLPADVIELMGGSPKKVARRLIEDAAVERYREGRLSHRQLGAMLGLDYWQAESFLRSRNVPLNYSEDDLDSDREAFQPILNDR